MNNKDNVYVEYDGNVAICLDRNPEGYYLDVDGFYKKCFDNCKFCYGPGNYIDNNCSKCKDNYLFISDSLYKNNCYERCQYFYYFNDTNDYICTDNCSGSYDKLITQKKYVLINAKMILSISMNTIKFVMNNVQMEQIIVKSMVYVLK